MRSTILLWRRAVEALGCASPPSDPDVEKTKQRSRRERARFLAPAKAGGKGGGDAAAHDGKACGLTQHLDAQARALIEHSVSRRICRLRLSVSFDEAERTDGAAGAAEAAEGPGPEGEAAANAQLIALLKAVADDLELEAQHAACFDGTVLGARPATGSTAAAGAPTPSASPSGASSAAVACALAAVQHELTDDLAPMLKYDNISSLAIEALTALGSLHRVLAALGTADTSGALSAVGAQMVDGWCAYLPELLQTNLGRALAADSWEPISEAAPRSSSAVDLITQLASLVEVYSTVGKLAPLPPRCHGAFLSLLEREVVRYVRAVVDGCPPLPPSGLRSRDCGAEAAAAPKERSAKKWGGGGGAAQAAERPRPCARSPALDAVPTRQLIVRLNNCEWVGEQVLGLAERLRADLLGFGRTPGTAVADVVSGSVLKCEDGCRDLLEYIVQKTTFYDLEPRLVSELYLPSPSAADPRLLSSLFPGPSPAAAPAAAPLVLLRSLLPKLEPTFAEVRAAVAPRWAQRLLETLLATFSLAVGAVLELPGRRLGPEHLEALHEDVALLEAFFRRGAALEERFVRNAVAFLHDLAENACGS